MSSGVAIIGMAARYPGAPDLAAFAELLFSGRDGVAALDAGQLAAEGVPDELVRDPNYVPFAATLEHVDRFDAARFSIPAHEAALMDPQQRFLLEVAAQALEDAGLASRPADMAVGAFVGAAISTYLLSRLAQHVLSGPSSANQLLAITGNDKDYTAAQLAYRLDLRGPVVSVQTACSTSLVALHLACQSLLNGECDVALAGGVSIRVPQRVGYVQQAEGMLSPTGRCRSYGAEADGTLFGSGCGVLVLKRLDDAMADGDAVRAVVLGSAINNDGARKMGFSAPSQEQQASVVSEALSVAGVDPGGIGYLEGHGTGTPLGDPIEVAALAQVFAGQPAGSIGLGSAKSSIGHTETAAGVAGVIKSVLMLEAGRFAPTLHAGQPNPRIGIEQTPFRLIGQSEPWQGPRRAGISSFGIGGSNAHVVIEAAPTGSVRPRPPSPPQKLGDRHWYLPPRKPGDLLGAGTSTGLGTTLHEADLSLATLPWLADHEIDGRLLLPGAAYAVSLAQLGFTAIQGLALTAPVEIPRDGAVPLRLVLDGATRARWFICRDDRWRPVAEADLAAGAAEWTSAPKVEVQARLDKAAWIARLAENGLRFGPALQSLNEVAIGQRMACAELCTDLSLVAVIDAGLQAIAAAFDGQGSYLPSAFGRLDVTPQIADATTVTAVLDPAASHDDSVIAHIWWSDRTGRTVGEAQQVVCRRIGKDAAEPFYQLVWKADVTADVDLVHARLEQIAAGFAANLEAGLEIAPRHRRYAALLQRHAAMANRADRPAEAATQLASQFPAHRHEIELIARTGAALPGLLSGRTDALDILFDHDGPVGSYAGSILADAINRTVAAVVQGLRPKRVLEIGAGTGATTAVILPVLPPDAEYLFTDIGPAFLRTAEDRFGKRPGFRTALFDIGREPLGQGLEPGYDLIVAANVLHVAPSLRQAVAHAAGLLAPGGRLVLVEGTRSLARLDLLFGATEGWWSFTDHDLRPEHPLVGAEEWAALLKEAGLVPTTVMQAGTQLVMTAATSPKPRWMALGGNPADAAALGLPWSAALPAEPLAGVVALTGLRPGSAAAGLTEILEIVRTMTAQAQPPRLLVPTVAAERINARDTSCADAAALTGFVRTLALEHPELHARSVDVRDAVELPAALAVEMMLADREDRTVWRDGRRRAARLASIPQGNHRPVRVTPALTMESLPEPTPGPGQVVVRVLAAGLNFKDVLIAGGLVAADRLGGECAGEIVHVGSGVQSLRPGQAVIAVGGGALAHYLVTDAALVVPKPSGLSFSTAAALPIAGATAWHALKGIGPGMRVLIHSATGGVGQFAVRLAKTAGAQVVATAGSLERRAWLQSQGIVEVHSSRDTGWPAIKPVDLVIGAVTGDQRDASLDLLKSGGRYVELGRVDVLSAAQVAQRRSDIAYDVVELDKVDAIAFGTLLRELVAVVEADPALVPPVQTLALERVEEAIGMLRRAEHRGKLVLCPGWPMRIRADGTYLVTGGRGGIGADIVDWLSQKGAGAILTLGRRPDADPHAVTGDVTDPAALAAVEARIDDLHLPPLRGVIHAAGVLADGAIANLSQADLQLPLGVKLGGARAIAKFWPDLELFVAFSSAGGVLGSPGQANHTAAAAALDAFMAGRRMRGQPGVAIDWAAWAGKGAAVERGADARLAAIGIGAISRETAFKALDRMMSNDLDRMVVLPVDVTRFKGDVPPVLSDLLRLDASTPVATAQSKDEPSARPSITSIGILRERVVEACARLLPPGQAVDPRRALTDQGLDSLGALELRNRLGDLAGVRLSATILFDQPNVDALVAYLAAEHLHLASRPEVSAPVVEALPPAPSPVDPAALDDVDLDAELARFEHMLAEGTA